MTPYWHDDTVTLLLGDTLNVLRGLPDGSVDCIVTSPPYYGLRDYGTPGQYGREASPAEYVETMRAVFSEGRRVLADDGTLWLNLGDSYSAAPSGPPGRTSAMLAHGSSRTVAEQAKARKQSDVPLKNLLGIPWRVAFALQEDGWILRNEVVWHKTNAMPESVTDRLSSKHEHVFLLAPNGRYHFDLDAIREPLAHPGKTRSPGVYAATADASFNRGQGGLVTGAGHPLGRNPGDVWSITTHPYPEAHFATFPIDLPIRCINAGCKPGGTVLDPFSGSGTTGEAARKLGRRYVGIDLNPGYHDLAIKRFAQGVLL